MAQRKNNDKRVRGAKYHNKVPPFKPDAHHWTRKGANGWKAKVAYRTEDEAWEWLRLHPHIVEQGFSVYQCRVCSLWHVGHLRKHE